jgi:hypothetical protein
MPNRLIFKPNIPENIQDKPAKSLKKQSKNSSIRMERG